MAEFEQYLADFNKFLEDSGEGFKNAWTEFHNAEEAYGKIVQLREQMLQNVLKEQGLAVCSESHHFTFSYHSQEDWKTKSAEELGIFPRNQMRLHYDQGITSQTDHFTMVTNEFSFADVLLLCPEHFSQTLIGAYGTNDVPRISSEVIEKDGKFIVTENGADITKLIKKRNFLRSRIEINGKPNPDVAVYRYLGIPDLPKKPDLNRVK